MARVIPITISNNAFPCTLNPTVRNRYQHCHLHLAHLAHLVHLAPLHAATDDGSGETANKSDETTSSSSADPDFERRIAELTYRKGKKAELRRLKKAGVPPSLASAYLKSGKAPVMLPPVPLQDPTSVMSGVPVKVGFSPYSERINGYLAGLGSTALLLVELGSGQSVVKYHSLGIVFLQIYTAAALAAVFIKYEKEKISVWPKTPPPATATAK